MVSLCYSSLLLDARCRKQSPSPDPVCVWTESHVSWWNSIVCHAMPAHSPGKLRRGIITKIMVHTRKDIASCMQVPSRSQPSVTSPVRRIIRSSAASRTTATSPLPDSLRPTLPQGSMIDRCGQIGSTPCRPIIHALAAHPGIERSINYERIIKNSWMLSSAALLSRDPSLFQPSSLRSSC